MVSNHGFWAMILDIMGKGLWKRFGKAGKPQVMADLYMLSSFDLNI